MLERLSTITRRPALAGQDIRADLIDIRPLGPESRFKLRLGAEGLATVPAAAGLRLDIPVNRFNRTDGRLAVRLGPDEWIVTAPEADGDLVGAELSAALVGQFHALVDIGHRHVALEVAGPRAADVLNAGCPLDLGSRAFPTGAGTRTLLGKAEIVVLRLDDRPTYRVECWRSFGSYVQAFLAEAAREHLPS